MTYDPKAIILSMVKYKDENGQINTIALNQKQLEKWVNCFEQKRNFVAYIGNEWRGVACDRIINFSVQNVSKDFYAIPPAKIASYSAQGINETATKYNLNKNLPETIMKTESKPEELPHIATPQHAYVPPEKKYFLVECKCGEKYTVFKIKTTKADACKACKQVLFTDYKHGKVTIPNHDEKGWLMTNRYLVDRKYPVPLYEEL